MGSRHILSGSRRYTLKFQRYDLGDTFSVMGAYIAGYLITKFNSLYIKRTPIFT